MAAADMTEGPARATKKTRQWTERRRGPRGLSTMVWRRTREGERRGEGEGDEACKGALLDVHFKAWSGLQGTGFQRQCPSVTPSTLASSLPGSSPSLRGTTRKDSGSLPVFYSERVLLPWFHPVSGIRTRLESTGLKSNGLEVQRYKGMYTLNRHCTQN